MNPNAARITTLGLCPDAKIRECLPTGIASLDAMFSQGDALLIQGQGFPRGAISEILGPESSGRTTLVHSLLAASTAQLEICAYVDTDDSFDPVSAAAAGVALSQLVWIRCGHNAGHALKAADYLLHAGGFGAIVLDLCQVPPRISNRIPISYWYRFRRAIENTPTILAIVDKQPLSKSCASLMLDMHRTRTSWKGAPGFSLLRGVELEAASRKPVRPATAAIQSEGTRMIFACIHGTSADLVAALPQIAAAFSPAFEQTASDTIVFRIDGLKRMHGTPQQIAQAIARHSGGEVNIAIAETADAAIIAARNFPGVTVAQNLNDLDVATLPLTEEMAQVLDTWGIYTFEHLAQLPETGLAERFGSTGVHLQRLARNAIHRPLKIFQPETTYEDRIELDHPVSLLEPLLFLIARLLNDQCAKLLFNAMAANEVTIRLDLEDCTKHVRTDHTRTLRLPVPMRESKSLLKLLQMDLEAHPPPAPTIALTLSLKPVHPRTVQTGIFLPVTPAPDKLELTLARIRGIVGENNVGIPELLNTHHPHPFHLANAQPQIANNQQPITNNQCFRYFRPPLPATVALDRNRPIRISASGIHGKVLNAAGPWRTSGDWWTTTVWNRDEWDIALSNGSLYRIYSDPHWFIEGSYD